MSAWQRVRETWRRWREPAWRAWLIDGVLFLAVLGGVMAYQTRGHLGSGAPAPDFVVRDLDGEQHRLSDFRGKPLVIYWWAPWCGVCAQESSTFSSFREAVGDDANVVSIAVDYPSLSSVQQYVAKHGVDYPVLLGNDELREAYGVNQYPSIYFVNAEGEVARTVVGYTTELGLRSRLMLVD